LFLFHPLTVDWELYFIIFLFVFYMVILVSWPKSWTWRVNPVDLSYCFGSLFFFFFNFILQHWVEIWLHNLFQFTFYEVIIVQWHGSHDPSRGHGGLILLTWIITWRVNPIDLDYYFGSLFYFIFQFYLSTLGGLEIRLHNLF